MKNKNSFILQFLILISIFTFPVPLFAQSGRSQTVAPSPANNEIKIQTPNESKTLTSFTLVTANGLEAFLKILNDNGKLGYRVEKSLNYGGEGVTQSYAAVLRLEQKNTFEYDWFSSPNKNLLEGRLNSQAKKGFYFINSYALTYCTGGTSEDEVNPTSPESLVFRLKKGDAFLLERKNGMVEPSREYKVFSAKVHLGDSAEKTIQAAISDSAQQGFRPIKILFARQGLLDFNLSVMVEKDLKATELNKIEYRFIKKTSGGLPKEINVLAGQGFRFIAGRRVGTVVMALMSKQDSEAVTYMAVDELKLAKEFDKTIALGNNFNALLVGDLTCGSTEIENEKLVFVKNTLANRRDYKVIHPSQTQNGAIAADSMSEFQRMLNDGYHVKEIIHQYGLKVIFEK